MALIGFVVSPGFATGVASPLASNARAAHCYGKAIVYVGDDAGPSISNPIIDFGQLASYGTQIGHDKDCADKVSAAAAQNANFNNKTWLCQQIGSGGQHRVSAYAAVGTLHYRVAQSIYVTCSGHVTTCTCPATWAPNAPTSVPGVTTDGKCKKLACQPDVITPFAANGTQIGTWGFSWGNAFYAWGTAANGGAPNCVTTPWVGT